MRKKKAMAGELALDESPSDPVSEYEVKVHNMILDRVSEGIRSWFESNETVCTDFAYLDLRPT